MSFYDEYQRVRPVRPVPEGLERHPAFQQAEHEPPFAEQLETAEEGDYVPVPINPGDTVSVKLGAPTVVKGQQRWVTVEAQMAAMPNEPWAEYVFARAEVAALRAWEETTESFKQAGVTKPRPAFTENNETEETAK